VARSCLPESLTSVGVRAVLVTFRRPIVSVRMPERALNGAKSPGLYQRRSPIPYATKVLLTMAVLWST
jgi:hypothetical protein